MEGESSREEERTGEESAKAKTQHQESVWDPEWTELAPSTAVPHHPGWVLRITRVVFSFHLTFSGAITVPFVSVPAGMFCLLYRQHNQTPKTGVAERPLIEAGCQIYRVDDLDRRMGTEHHKTSVKSQAQLLRCSSFSLNNIIAYLNIYLHN